MENTFDGANMLFTNRGIHVMLGEVMHFRKQLTVRPEFKGQSGWTDALNRFMVNGLERIADTLENITYNPTDKSQAELEAEAADTTRSLSDDYDAKSINVDNVVMPGKRDMPVVWKLDGSDLDFPQIDPQSHPNTYGRMFITGIDELFVMLTRLDSRFQPNTMTRDESVMVRAHLNTLYTLLQRKGGEVNKPEIPTGTLPSQEVETFSA